MLPESNEFPDSSFTIRLLVEDISGYPDYSPDIMQLEVTGYSCSCNDNKSNHLQVYTIYR